MGTGGVKMDNHRDPTANAAVGAVNREWKRMVRLAISLRKANREPDADERRLFTGIYRQLLSASMVTLEKMKEGKFNE